MLLLEEVQKLNQENAEKSDQQFTTGYLDLEVGPPAKGQQPDAPACSQVDYLREDSQVAENDEVVEAVSQGEVGAKEEAQVHRDKEDTAKEKKEDIVEGTNEDVISPEKEGPEPSTDLEEETDSDPTRYYMMNSSDTNDTVDFYVKFPI